MNKIGWCDMTWNPVWGCKNHCEYCYARKIASFRYDQIAEKEYQYMQNRGGICQGEFANRLRHFVPTFIESNFNKKLPIKPQRIFVGSMSEIYYWKKEWMEMVLDKIRQYPQHTFQFLTKFPRVYNKYIFPNNCWLGFTVTEEYSFEENDCYLEDFRYKWHTFISFEPLLGRIDVSNIKYLNVDWVIIGAETGNRKDKVIPKNEWILDIVDYCNEQRIPVYIKDNLIKYYPVYGNMKAFPKEVNHD